MFIIFVCFPCGSYQGLFQNFLIKWKYIEDPALTENCLTYSYFKHHLTTCRLLPYRFLVTAYLWSSIFSLPYLDWCVLGLFLFLYLWKIRLRFIKYLPSPTCKRLTNTFLNESFDEEFLIPGSSFTNKFLHSN